jgi:hypothetical protein
MWHDSIAIELKPTVSVISFVIYYLAVAWLLRLGRPGFLRSTGARVSFVLAQTQPVGGHYLIDIIGGVVAAGLSILRIRRLR